MHKNTKLLTILLMSIALFSACTNNSNVSGSGQSANTNATANAENKAVAQNTAIENKTTPIANINKPTDEMPKFKKGEAYKSVREKLIKAGWIPFKSKEAQECNGDDERCKDYPEMEGCAGTGLGYCNYLWKKGNKTLTIYTIGDIPEYNGQEFVKPSQQSKTDREDSSWKGGAMVHTPPSNVRESPDGKVICVIREKKMIIIDGSTNITDDTGEWLRTKACGKSGVIHSSQINVVN